MEKLHKIFNGEPSVMFFIISFSPLTKIIKFADEIYYIPKFSKNKDGLKEKFFKNVITEV